MPYIVIGSGTHDISQAYISRGVDTVGVVVAPPADGQHRPTGPRPFFKGRSATPNQTSPPR